MQIELDKMNNNCNDRGEWLEAKDIIVENIGGGFIINKVMSETSLRNY